MIVSTGLKCSLAVYHLAARGQNENGHAGSLRHLAQPPHNIVARDAGHHHINNRQIGGRGQCAAEAIGAVGAQDHLVFPSLLENHPQHLQEIRIVVNHHNLCHPTTSAMSQQR